MGLGSAPNRRQALRLSDSMLLSSWRDHVCQALESDQRSPHAVTDVLQPESVNSSFKTGLNTRSVEESPGLINAKKYLVHLAQKDPALEPEDSRVVFDRFTRRVVLQERSRSTVLQAVDNVTLQNVILKVYDKRLLTADLEARQNQEIAILRRADHPNVVDLLDVVETTTSLVLVLEHCTHGDLVRDIVLNRSDADISTVCGRLKQVIQAVQHIHKLGYMHCAISPTSILLRRDDSLCLTDLSHALKIGSVGAGHRAGLLGYMPPEMIALSTPEEIQAGALPRMHPYPFGPAVDVWQIGCLAFEMLAGRSPFEFAVPEHTAAAVLFADISDWPPCIGPRMQSLISSCLRKDPSQRPSLEKLLDHSAFSSGLALAVTAATALGTRRMKRTAA